MSIEDHDVIVAATYVAPLMPVTATAPTRSGNVITIPTIAGVIYRRGGSPVSGTITLTVGQSADIVAAAAAGYVLNAGTTAWNFAYQNVQVTAAAPTKSGNTVTIPSVTGVVYSRSGSTVTGTLALTAEAPSATITAAAANGYALNAGTTSWSFTYEAPPEG